MEEDSGLSIYRRRTSAAPLPVFDSPADAVNLLFLITARLAAAVAWLALVLAHTTLLALALLGLWATSTGAAEVAAALRMPLQSWPAAALGAAGVSAASLLSAYWWLVRWLHRRVVGWVVAALLPRPPGA